MLLQLSWARLSRTGSDLVCDVEWKWNSSAKATTEFLENCLCTPFPILSSSFLSCFIFFLFLLAVLLLLDFTSGWLERCCSVCRLNCLKKYNIHIRFTRFTLSSRSSHFPKKKHTLRSLVSEPAILVSSLAVIYIFRDFEGRQNRNFRR